MSEAMIVSMRRLFRGAILAGLCGLAAACASNTLTVMSASQANSELALGYPIDAGDKLKITVFDEEPLTGEYNVGMGGALSLPLLEPIVVKNMNPKQVAQLIEERLSAGGYVLYPRVSVDILEYRPFFILGEVAAPGAYPHGGELTLEQAVAKAGGYTPRAKRSAVVLKRQDWAESKLIKQGDAALRVAPGDTIIVQEAFF